MDIKPIRTDADYKASLKEISALMESDPEPGTADGDRLDILATLVEAYENRHFRMERQRLKPKDLEPMIGQRKISIQKPIAPRLGSVLLPLQWPTTTAYSLRVLPQTPPRTIRAPVGAAPPPR